MLRISTQESPKEIKITSDHPAFQDTPFENAGFSVTALPLSRTIMARIRRNHSKSRRGRVDVDEIAVATDIFVECVKDWDGFADEKGNPLPCDEGTKRLVATNYWQLSAAIVGAVMEAQNEEMIDKDAARGN